MSTLEDVKTAAWSPGTVIEERYVLVENVEDDTTSVYRAETVDRQEPRLIRALGAELADDPVAAREFGEICELIRKVSHPNLPRIEATGEFAGRPFMATDAREGRPLDQLLRDEGPLEPERACGIARQIASALEAAHRFGLLYLDLDPHQITVSGRAGEEHVTLEAPGRAQMRMSGIRRSLSGGRSSFTPGTGALQRLMPATPGYCAPEAVLARSAESLDGRADLYALGVLIYQLLTGRLPISAVPAEDDGLGLLAAQVDADSTPPELDASIPAPLASLIRQLLETRRELRPSTARVVADWLKRTAAVVSPRRPARAAALKEEKHRSPMPVPVFARERERAPERAPQRAPEPVPEPAPERAIVEPAASIPAVALSEPPAPPATVPAVPGPPVPRTTAAQPPEVMPPAKPASGPVLPPASEPPASEPVLTSAIEPVPRTIKEPPAGLLLPPESAIEAAKVLDELELEAAPAGTPAPPIVLRPGGRVIGQTVPPADTSGIAGDAEISSAGPLTPESVPPLRSAKLGSPTSVLFKTHPAPQPPAGWGRRALAVLAVVLMAALALFFIGKSKQLQWNSPTPTTVDQEHSLSRPDANAEVTPSANPSNTSPSAAPAAPASAGPASNQPQTQRPPVTEPPLTAGSEQNPAAGGVTAPSGEAAPGTAKAPAQRGPGTGSATESAEVQRAVAAGDVFYETGQYDLAVQAYEEPLKNHPANQLLRSRIARAKKAKAAEEEYLGQ